mgnify:CR=1 FL=1
MTGKHRREARKATKATRRAREDAEGRRRIELDPDREWMIYAAVDAGKFDDEEHGRILFQLQPSRTPPAQAFDVLSSVSMGAALWWRGLSPANATLYDAAYNWFEKESACVSGSTETTGVAAADMDDFI